MSNQRIDEQRKRLKSLLGAIIDTYKSVGKEMEGEKHHRRGIALRSLEPKSGNFVAHSEQGVTCFYTHSDGNRYEINIHQR